MGGSQVCTGFGNIPTVPYYYDPDCTEGRTGCDADGVHVQCRFCGEDPFEAVPCPEPLAGVDICRSTLGNRTTAYFWDEGCESGQLGCFADGRHAQCRFCGSGSYSNITCPEASSGNLRGRQFPLAQAARTSRVSFGCSLGCHRSSRVARRMLDFDAWFCAFGCRRHLCDASEVCREIVQPR